MVQPAGEVGSRYPTQVASTHHEVTAAHPVKMTTAQPAAKLASTAAVAAAARNRIGRHASASHRYGGNDDRNFVQHKFLQGSFLSGLR